METVLAILLLFTIAVRATVAAATQKRNDSHDSSAQGELFKIDPRFYSRNPTHTDGPRCEYRPTCAIYLDQTVRKHRAFPGIFLRLDRLMHHNRSTLRCQLPLPIHDTENRRIY